MKITKKAWRMALLVFSSLSMEGAGLADVAFRPLPSNTANVSPLHHPEHFRGIDELEGKVEEVDASAHALVVKDALDHHWKIYVDRDTAITDMDSGTMDISEVKTTQKVHVYYTPANMRARQVDIIGQGFAEAILFAS